MTSSVTTDVITPGSTIRVDC